MKSRLISLILLGLSSNVFGGPEFIPIQEMAQGQSLTGANLLNDSLYSNPAASSFTQVYSVEGLFLMPKSFEVSVLDSRTSTVGGALGYFRKAVDGTDVPMQGVKLGLAGRASQTFGLGITGKVLWGPNVADVTETRRLTDLDAGILANFAPVQFGLTARNLFGGDVGLVQEREWAFGARATYQDVLYFSASAYSRMSNFKPYQYGIGAEYVSPYYFSLKGGFRIVTANSNSYWSLGLSFISPKFSLHYAVELPNQSDTTVQHLLGLTMMM